MGAFRSLRSKRFRVVSEQRKTEEWRWMGFSGLAAPKKGFDKRSSFFAQKPHGNGSGNAY